MREIYLFSSSFIFYFNNIKINPIHQENQHIIRDIILLIIKFMSFFSTFVKY